jgi:hypothetical protein
MSFEEIRCEVNDGVLTITLDCPNRLDALYPWRSERPFKP